MVSSNTVTRHYLVIIIFLSTHALQDTHDLALSTFLIYFSAAYLLCLSFRLQRVTLVSVLGLRLQDGVFWRGQHRLVDTQCARVYPGHGRTLGVWRHSEADGRWRHLGATSSPDGAASGGGCSADSANHVARRVWLFSVSWTLRFPLLLPDGEFCEGKKTQVRSRKRSSQ